LLHSKFDVENSPLNKMNSTGRIKSCVVENILQLLSLSEYLKSTLNNEKTLLIMEGLNPIFQSQKVFFNHCF
jgi:hypothetical protein